jgi:hypothetical protein
MPVTKARLRDKPPKLLQLTASQYEGPKKLKMLGRKKALPWLY